MSSLLRTRMIEQMTLRHMAEETKRSYVAAVAGLVKFYKKSPDLLSREEIQKYLLHLHNERHLAWMTCNVAISGLRFFYRYVVERPEILLAIPKRRAEKHLPMLLSIEEVRRLLDALSNPKHRALLMTAYGAGLRVSELVRLQPRHIESQRKMVRVEQGKGRKDRYTLLPDRLLAALRDYWRLRRPKVWMFPGVIPGRPISKAAAQRIFYKAKKASGVTGGRGIHTLRHCFCTHLLEAGYDVYEVKQMMGHSSLATTMGYRHITPDRIKEIKSPLDTDRFA